MIRVLHVLVILVIAKLAQGQMQQNMYLMVFVTLNALLQQLKLKIVQFA